MLTWEALYKDGTKLTQYNEKGEANGYENIDRSKLAAFCIRRDNEQEPFYRVFLNSEQRLIFRRRVWKKTTGERKDLLMIGWQQTVNGKNIQNISYIHENGQIDNSGEWVGGLPILTSYET